MGFLKGFTYLDQHRMLKRISTYPSHHPCFGDTMIEALRTITRNESKNRGLGPEAISNDLIIDDTMPTLDTYLTLGKRDNLRIRVLIIDRINSEKSNIPKRGIKRVGAVVYDYGNVCPMMYFGVARDSNEIQIIDHIEWYKFGSLCKDAKVRAEKDMPTVEDVRKVLQCWYAMEHVMLYPRLSAQYERYNKIIERARVFTAENCYGIWKDPIKYKDSYHKDGTPRTYNAYTAIWFKRGYRTYNKKTGTWNFIQQQTCVRHGGKDVPIDLVLSPFTDTFQELMENGKLDDIN